MEADNLADQMEWATISGSEWYHQRTVVHSTPLSFRPAPTASPNLSAIPVDIEDQISMLIARFTQLKLQ